MQTETKSGAALPLRDNVNLTRSAAAVTAGVVVWLVLALVTDSLVMRAFEGLVLEGGRVEHTGLLLFIGGYATIYEVVAGYVTALVAGRSEMAHAVVLALVQLALGVVAMIAFIDTAPLWYHFGALALVIPAVTTGGLLRVAQRRQRA